MRTEMVDDGYIQRGYLRRGICVEGGRPAGETWVDGNVLSEDGLDVAGRSCGW